MAYNNIIKRRKQSTPEEIANTISHAIGLLMGIAGSVILFISTCNPGDIWRIVSSIIYSSTMLGVYAASTLHHSIKSESGNLEYIFQRIDNSAIYLFIAGTYTPFLLVKLRDTFGWSMLIAIWTIALAGVALKILSKKRFLALTIISYLIMGWLAIVAAPIFMGNFPLKWIIWIVAGGAFYSVGILFLASGKVRYHHAIWHIFVILGSICHYVTILFFVMPE